MTYHDGFDRTVSEWLDEQAGRGAPGYLDEILTRTTRTRQRPWWSSLERWLPVDITAYRSVLVRPAPMRAFALLVILALLIVAVVAVAVGSRRALPLPYGLANNGAVIASADGDIFSIDPKSGRASMLIADAAFDFSPVFSRDGTKFYFLRAPDPTNVEAALELVVANADGTGIRTLSPAVPGLDWQDWSPDGTRIAFLSRPKGAGTANVINVVNVDGTGLRTLNVDRPAFYPSWLPPDGKEIVFRGERLQPGDPAPGIFAVHPDGTGLRSVSTRPAVGDDDYQNVSVSPDGTRVAYTGSPLDSCCNVHVLDMASGNDRILPAGDGAAGGYGPVFSPDGKSIVYLRVNRRLTEGGQFQIVVAPADGSGTGTALGPLGSPGANGPSINNYVFTPDGNAIVAGYDDEQLTRVLPLDGSPSSVVSHGGFAAITYQRLAP
jgi:dipeptidyl aminopeptidase/acylaminoacyl peptidase